MEKGKTLVFTLDIKSVKKKRVPFSKVKAGRYRRKT
jgi:hypothetical protein